VQVRRDGGCEAIDEAWLAKSIERGAVEVAARTVPPSLVQGLAQSLVQGLAQAVVQRGRVSFGTIAVRVVNDRVMRELHERYCGHRSTTDVLTFERAGGGGEDGQVLGACASAANAADEPSDCRRVDVDLVLCRDEAARQAAARGLPLERELLLYAIHGLLHCAGHDDHDPEAFARMHAEEDRILESIGVGRTFAAPESSCDAPRSNEVAR